jgi:hypothetical protein
MKPMMQDNGHQDRSGGQRQYHIGCQGLNLARADQRRDSGNGQEQRQMQQAVAAMVMPVPAMSVVVVVGVAAMPPAMAAMFGLPFIERKFVAHADIKSTHKSP